jgi:hypothetical protein
MKRGNNDSPERAGEEKMATKKKVEDMLKDVVDMWDKKHPDMQTMVPEKGVVYKKIRKDKDSYFARIRLLKDYNIFYEFKVYPGKTLRISLCNDVSDKCEYSSSKYEEALHKLMKKIELPKILVARKYPESKKRIRTDTETVALKLEGMDFSNEKPVVACKSMEWLIEFTYCRVLKTLCQWRMK